MASNERIRKYLDAGTVLGQVTRGRAEEIVRELVNAGDIQRGQAQEWVDNLVDRSRKTSEQILELVRHEVSTQLGKIDASAIEAIANRVADVLKSSADAGRTATKDVTAQAAKSAKGVQAQATKTAKRARAAATQVAPSRRHVKKAPAKKAAAKKSTATKATIAKKSTAKAPAKKAAKKAPAKKAAS